MNRLVPPLAVVLLALREQMKKIATRRSSTNRLILVYLMEAWCIKQVRQKNSDLPHETIPNEIVNKFYPFQ